MGPGKEGGVTTGPIYADGDVIGVALDLEVGTVFFYLNGALVVTETLPGWTPGDAWLPALVMLSCCSGSAPVSTTTANFGASPFVHPVPPGFVGGI